MHSLSVMDWNAKTPFQWDWDSLLMFNAKAFEIPTKIQPTDWGNVGEGGIDNGSVYSSGGGGCSGSDLGHGSSSKSSISASIDSSSKGGMKASKITFDTFEDFSRDFSKKDLTREATGTSSTLGPSVGSGEPPIGLRLGKRTYFEDVGAGNTTKTSSFSMIPTSSTVTAKRSRATNQNLQTPRCQVEGCNLDLTSAKDYHRRHRVCESHSKSQKVTVTGLERRFCQQCSRFHDLLEFDEKKRSCRKRLSDHNARRRKPQPEPIQFNSARLSSSLYDGRQHMSLVLNRVPLVHTRPAVNPTWESACGFKPTLAKGYLLRPAKAGDVDKQLHMPGNELSSAISILRHDSNRLLPSKGTTGEILNQDLQAFAMNSYSAPTPDGRRALSLLSTNSWGLGETEPTSINQLMHVNHNSTADPVMRAMPQGLPFASSEYWQAEQQSAMSRVHTLASHGNSNNQFEEFQLFKAPYETGIFYSNQMN